jgi:predicted nucleotidyltransferase
MATAVQLAVPMGKIAEFCQRWHIEEFSLFGSILGERFQADSDVDVLVRFAPDVVYSFGQLDKMQEELEAIFGRPVDLVDKQAVQESANYIRRREILESAQVIYAQ